MVTNVMGMMTNVLDCMFHMITKPMSTTLQKSSVIDVTTSERNPKTEVDLEFCEGKGLFLGNPWVFPRLEYLGSVRMEI